MSETPLKVVFMGTPDFAASALQAVLDSAHDVIAVYSQPPRPKGRGHKVQKSPVHTLAEEHDIPVYTPKSLKSEESQAEFAALGADIAVVAAYGLLLPKAVLEAPAYGCLNIHASLLPRWRGASPIQRAIWAGDDQSGVTIMQMDEGLDTGDMLKKVEVPLTDTMTASALHDALAEKGAALAVQVLDTIARDGAMQGEKQNEDAVTYAHLLKKADGQVDWNQSASQIDRQVRALNPWPGVWADIQGKRFKIQAACVADDGVKGSAGQVVSKNGLIACGDGTALQIKMLQPEGKKAMDFASALNGGYITVEA